MIPEERKISYMTFLGFFEEYYRDLNKNSRYETRLYENLRLGQAFMNKFFPDVPDYSELYNEVNPVKAYQLIFSLGFVRNPE